MKTPSKLGEATGSFGEVAWLTGWPAHRAAPALIRAYTAGFDTRYPC